MTDNHDDFYLADLAAFDEAIANTANGGKPLVIYFTATHSPFCRSIKPIYEDYVETYPQLVLKEVNVHANRDATYAAFIQVCKHKQAMPTFKVYKNGIEHATMCSANPDRLVELLDMAKDKNA